MNIKGKLKKLAAAFLAVAGTFAPFGAWADTWEDTSGNVWTYSGGTVTAVSFETTNLTIPDTLGGNPVTAFNANVFAGQTRAVRVTIPDTVTAIPAEAFLNCGNLKAVTIQGEGLKSIGARAFKGCGNLGSFTMPNSVTSLGQGAFSGCSAMESVTLSDGLTTLTDVPYWSGDGHYWETSGVDLNGGYADGLFYNCTSLKTVNWGKNIKTIGNIAFLNCSSLERVEIPDTVTSIGWHAFVGCSSLGEVKIGNGVTTVGRMAFRALPNLTKVTFGAKVNEIGVQAFQDCVNLQNFTLPNTIQYLRYRCFAGCNKTLTSVTIPTNKDELETELEKGVFSGCSKLATVTFGDTVKTLTDVPYWSGDGHYWETSGVDLNGGYADGLFYNCTSLKTVNWGKNIKTIGNIAFLNCSSLERVEIPDTVTSIGWHAFVGCSSLGEVKIGNGVTTVGRMAFRALPNLTKVTFGAKVNEIGVQAFQDCVNLQNFTLPNTIQYLRYRCFAGCNKTLTSVTIPTNKDELETELEKGVFSGCSKLATVTFGDTVKTLTDVPYWSGDGHYWETSGVDLNGGYADGLFYNCTSLKTVNWGKNIKTIGNIAFLNCSSLERVEIPDTVTSIGWHAFVGCSSLGEVKIGNGVTTVGRMAFRALPNLTKVTFGAKVNEIGVQAFQDCVNLQNFTLPNTIQYLRYRCFAGCNKTLTSVTIPTNKDELETELEKGVFSGCSKLATVTFGDTVKTLTDVPYWSGDGHYWETSGVDLNGGYADGLFYNCTSLKTINWGAGIKTIGNIAFLNCSSLTELVLPANITDIGDHAFCGCSSLKTVVVKGSVNSIGRRAFANCKALYYVDFQGDSMDFDPGAGIFDFDKPDIGVYVKPGSTGWTGIAEVSGLPESGMWGGAHIAYGPPPDIYYTVRFHRNDASDEKTAEYEFDYGVATRIPSLNSLGWARRGIDFLGWATSRANADAGKVWKNDWAFISTAAAAGNTLDVYAVWSLKPDSYAIEFIRNDGAGTWRTVGFNYGEKTRMPSLANGLGWARRGYTFKGWALTTADAAAGKVWKGDWAYVATPVKAGEVITVYAVWELKPGYYQIRYNKNDGTGKWRALGYEYGVSTKLPTIKALNWTVSGKTFKGWATSAANASAGKVWKTDGAAVSTAAAEGKTLSIYAIWE